MMPRTSDFTAALLRTFAVQGSWNYRTMIGGGIAYALLPLLQRIHAGDPVALREAIERHSSAFNAHPYLSPLAIGAFARVEHDGRDPETIERFRAALRGPLGALGDQAVWAGWRPFCTLSAVVAFCMGLDARVAALAFVLVYNAAHVGLRVWGLRMGWTHGLDVGPILKGSPLKAIGAGLVPINAALIGAVVVLLSLRTPGFGPSPVLGGAIAVVSLGAFFLPARAGTLAILTLFASVGVWLLS